MRLRPYRLADFETLYQIDQACFPPSVSYSREELARFISHPNSGSWVAEHDGETVGFLIAHREPQKLGHIVTIDVVLRWRRRGVGALLMDAAEEWARGQGLRMIYLETEEDNAVAQLFYQARGYRKVEKLERYYGNGTAAWVMVKWLEGRPPDINN